VTEPFCDADPVVGADLANRGAKARQDVDGFLVTVGVGEPGEAAQIHEGEGAVDSHGSSVAGGQRRSRTILGDLRPIYVVFAAPGWLLVSPCTHVTEVSAAS